MSNNLILVYLTFSSLEKAQEMGRHLLDQRLCACINIFPEMTSMFFWPPHQNTLEGGQEVVLIAKTTESKYQALEDEVHRIHTDEVPCVMAIPILHVAPKYRDWLVGELQESND